MELVRQSQRSKFYHYRQNNSGGSFVYSPNSGISVHVVVEANSYEQANALAENIGLYFDGDGDCSCCGRRWTEQWDDSEAEDFPHVYGDPVHEHKPIWNMKWIDNGPEGYVHYLNGRIESFCE